MKGRDDWAVVGRVQEFDVCLVSVLIDGGRVEGGRNDIGGERKAPQGTVSSRDASIHPNNASREAHIVTRKIYNFHSI